MRLLVGGRAVALGAAVLLCAFSALTTSALEAAEESLSGLHGERLGTPELSQGTTIAIVWASWSPRSRDVAQRVNPIAGAWGKRARVITVNFQEDRAAVEGFLAGKAISAPVFLDTDGAFSKRFGVATLPSMLVLKDGAVVFRGKLPDDPDRVLSELLH